eukprot:c29285_g8_i1 orf=39-353(-)
MTSPLISSAPYRLYNSFIITIRLYFINFVILGRHIIWKTINQNKKKRKISTKAKHYRHNETRTQCLHKLINVTLALAITKKRDLSTNFFLRYYTILTVRSPPCH